MARRFTERKIYLDPTNVHYSLVSCVQYLADNGP